MLTTGHGRPPSSLAVAGDGSKGKWSHSKDRASHPYILISWTLSFFFKFGSGEKMHQWGQQSSEIVEASPKQNPVTSPAEHSLPKDHAIPHLPLFQALSFLVTIFHLFYSYSSLSVLHMTVCAHSWLRNAGGSWHSSPSSSTSLGRLQQVTQHLTAHCFRVCVCVCVPTHTHIWQKDTY